ncbi:hypothetical protein PAECIP111892_00310 [Paenibacillus auburnensis]|uniref:DUF4179 domain-containing protein n=1 Tax=Paenibacillus auburnensis TaxID=2905649 RepID=A0ABM9BN19_9BACL|nr:hypothetical protein [Paenibacillus auburnensis]CAH1190723.1 hypothetical protein PAECIP111892_00310 [Paenibacillus auburnensis]
MAGNEEKLLKDYFEELSGQVEEVPEIKLQAAIRSGMLQPVRYRISAVKKRFAICITVVMAAALLFAFPWIGQQVVRPHSAQIPPEMVQRTGEFDEYRVVAGINPAGYDNTTVLSAIEAGLIQRVSGATARQNGFVLTVDGIAADRMGIIILYSLQNNTKQRARVNVLQLTGTGDELVNTLPGSAWNAKDVPTGTTRGYEVLQWGEEFSSLPEQITFEVKLGEYKPADFGNTLAQLSVPILLDKEQMAKTGEVQNIDQTLTIAGQHIQIDDVYLSTTGVYLDYAYDPQNTKQIFSMLNPQLLMGSKGDFTNLALLRTLAVEGNSRLVFANDSRFSQPLKLQIGGILALDKEATELIIDTEKQEIIKAPDNHLKMSLYSTDKGSTMILEYLRAPAKQRLYNSLMIGSEFTDADGQIHSASQFDISIPQRQESAEKKSIPLLHYLGLGSNKYSQPLTFTITGYPNPIQETLSLPIRK